MNNLRVVLLLSAIALTFETAMAQTYAESALMFSRTRPGGSARIQALGGAQVSLGGDYSSAFSNPAGLGMFNKSEISITPGLTGFSTGTKYLGNNGEDKNSKLQIPGFAIVFHRPGNDPDGAYIGGTFTISLNRINDFSGDFSYQGSNQNSSIINSFISQANGATTEQFEEGGPHYNSPTGLAYYNYLIGPTSSRNPDTGYDDLYFTDVQENFELNTSPSIQNEEVQRKGAINQWSLSYGANFLDKYFVGGGIGISSLRYQGTKLFRESYNDLEANFDELLLEENVEITGSGINATLGAIVRPVDFIQFGISYTTPTRYQLTDTYSASMSTYWNNFTYVIADGDDKVLNNESASTDILTSEYSYTVPSKLNLGLTFISKFGFITTDLEFTNPGKGKYSSDTPGISYRTENEDIKSFYTSVVNYRVGGEFRYKILRARAGFGVQGNPYSSSIDVDDKITTISGGLGVRLSKFYIDFALVQQSSNPRYQPYTYDDGSGWVGPVVDLNRKITSGILTVGFTY